LKAIEFVLQINRFFTILVKSICQINLFFFLIEHVCGIKRVKRTLSPTTSTSIFINSNNDNSEHDDDDEYDDDEDDERDSSSNPTTMSPKSMLTCPSCDSTYHRLGHLLRHAKRKHRIDLSSYDGPHTFDMLTSQTNQLETSDIELNKDSKEQMHTEDMKPCEKSSQQPSKSNINSFFVLKKKPIKSSFQMKQFHHQFPIQIQQQIVLIVIIKQLILNNLNHILLLIYVIKIIDVYYVIVYINIVVRLNICFYSPSFISLYYKKLKGDCSFHIRRKHHRYSINSNDYIQRFLFDTNDGDETMSTQSGGHGLSINGSINNAVTSREQDEPVRYFGCPYCDYTSNYGGDVR
jgi:hypothetical protein